MRHTTLNECFYPSDAKSEEGSETCARNEMRDASGVKPPPHNPRHTTHTHTHTHTHGGYSLAEQLPAREERLSVHLGRLHELVDHHRKFDRHLLLHTRVPAQRGSQGHVVVLHVV